MGFGQGVGDGVEGQSLAVAVIVGAGIRDTGYGVRYPSHYYLYIKMR